MSGRGPKDLRLVLGASPRVDLLPPEVAERKRGAAVKRSVVMGVVGAIVLSAGAYAFASWQAVEASMAYDQAQTETNSLLAQQNEFAAVRTLTTQLATVNDAQQIGAMTEINWNDFYGRVVPTLPADLSIDSFAVESSSPTVDISPSTAPGQGAHVARATFNAITGNLASAQSWVVNLKNLPEYGGALATSITREEGFYRVTVFLLITDAAYTDRYQPAPAAAEPAPADPAATESETE